MYWKKLSRVLKILQIYQELDKSFQINVVYRIQIEKRVKWHNYVTKKIWKKFFFAASRVRFFFDTWSDRNKQIFSLA